MPSVAYRLLKRDVVLIRLNCVAILLADGSKKQTDLQLAHVFPQTLYQLLLQFDVFNNSFLKSLEVLIGILLKKNLELFVNFGICFEFDEGKIFVDVFHRFLVENIFPFNFINI